MTKPDVTSLAANLARTCGWHVFPVASTKRPATPEGFRDAAADPDAIAALWRKYPAPLIGIATGTVSGFDVLDIDAGDWPADAKPETIEKHQSARAWWQTHAERLPATRAYRSRSGGAHLYFRHAPGVVNSQGKLALGVDVRGDGGYAIHWFAAGFSCLNHDVMLPWPPWLLADVLAKPAPAPIRARLLPRDGGERAIDAILRLVASAPEGQRNGILHWAACRLGERVKAAQIGSGEAEGLLIAAASAAGLAEREARTTARSGLGRTR